MMIKSPILSAAKNISSSKSILALRMDKKSDYKKFVKWIDSSSKELKKAKLPKKKDLKKISNFGITGGGLFGGTGKGGGGSAIGGILGLLGLGGGAAAAKSLLGGASGATTGAAKGAEALKNNKGFLSRFFPKYAQQRGLQFPTRNEALAARAFSAQSGVLGPATSPPPPVGTPKPSRIPGGRIGGPLSIAFAGVDFAMRKGGGQTNLQAGVGAGAGLAGGLAGASLGAKIGAGIGTLIAPGIGTGIGAILGSLIGGTAGSMGAGSLADKATGADKIQTRLKEQEAKQKEATKLNFGDIVDKFDKVITKFEGLSFGLTGITNGTQNLGQNQQTNPFQEPSQYPPLNPTELTYDGPVTGNTFFPLPGGQAGAQSDQQYGAPRDGGTRAHAGLDIVKFQGNIAAPVAAYKTGKVVASVSNGYNGYVTIDHGGGLKTRYYHTSPSVNVGDIVYGGQQIANLYPDGQNTHLHFEVYRGGSPVDPKSAGLGQNIPAPLSKEKAKESHDKSIGNTAKPGVNTTERQQSPEEFFKGTSFEKTFRENKDAFYGKEVIRNTRGAKQTKVKPSEEVQRLQSMYNSYVRQIREKREKEISSTDSAPKITPVASQTNQELQIPAVPIQTSQSGLVIMTPVGQQVQVASQPQFIPVPIQSSNNSGGTIVASVSETELLNSLWNNLLLTKLSG
jgi:murein DD-endopeptidase MepM/ murein hydrolase activator NlpD